MIRLFFCLFAFSSITLNLYSQKTNPFIRVEGYYVTRFLKKEISFSYDQKINKLKGESYSIPIDYTQVSFFVPLYINDRQVIEKDKLAKLFSTENNLHKDSIYYLPLSKQIEKYAKVVFNMNIVLAKEICIFSEVDKISPYYIDVNEDKYLYKCIFIDGEAIQTTILNTEEKRFPFHLDAYSVNKKSQSIDLFFILKINSYSTIINIKGLKEWVPYLNVK